MLQGEIYSARFHPSGETLASVGFDRLVCKYDRKYFSWGGGGLVVLSNV